MTDALSRTHVEPEEAPMAARAVVTHAHNTSTVAPQVLQRPRSHLTPATDRIISNPHKRQDASSTHSSHTRLHDVVESVGTGFLYGALFGGLLAVVEGYRESPQHQRLRGMLHHGKHVIPATAGRIALVTGLFRAASWVLDAGRGHDRADLWTVLLAAPLAGAALRLRHGPRAAAHTAFTFGSVGAVMVLFNVAQAKAGRRAHDPPGEVLEEIAFAEEVDEIDIELD